jgi:uncharacterized RDD family membrane protein YckC
VLKYLPLQLPAPPYPANPFAEAPATLAYATRQQRCVNFIIDNLIMKFTLAYATGILFYEVVQYFFPSFGALIFNEQSTAATVVVLYMVSRVNYAIYYSIAESCFNGYTLGKLITGTRAVQACGANLRPRQAIHRSFSRFLPFEFLSGFGKQPWHDSWTKTTVVRSNWKPKVYRKR